MRFVWTVLFVCYGIACFSQNKSYTLELKGLPKIKNQQSVFNFTDSLTTIHGLHKVLTDLQISGFFEAKIDSATWIGQTLQAKINIGKEYIGLYLSNGNIPEELISQIGLKDQFQKSRVLSLIQVKKTYQKILFFYENNGYPFVTTWLDSLHLKNKNLVAQIFVDPHRYISVDTLRLVGSAKVNQGFLTSYLDLKNGAPYDESKVKLIDKKLRDLPFVTVPRPMQVVFAGEEAKFNIFLDKQNANQFDGIIGFLPNSNNGKLQLTGDFKLNLKNALKSGELLDFNYRGLPSQSQELAVRINYPYIFRMQLGFNFDFQLFKRDTSFLNLNTKFSFDYSFNGNQKLSFFYENFNGNQVAKIKNNTPKIPDFANINSSFYGLAFSYLKLDNKISPMKGADFVLNGGIGNRKINSSINFNPDDYFEKRAQVQAKLSSDLKYYLKLGKQSVLFFHNFSSYLSGDYLFKNEGFRIGGAKTLRGFDEQSLNVSSFLVQTVEFRYFIEKNSYLNIFYDQAFVSQRFNGQNNKDHPAGFGLGITFQTKVGIASLSYALGKQKNIPVDLQKGKIHFGIVSYF